MISHRNLFPEKLGKAAPPVRNKYGQISEGFVLEEGGTDMATGIPKSIPRSPEARGPQCTRSGTYCRHLTSIEILPLHPGPVNHKQMLQVVARTGPRRDREQGRRPHRFLQGPLAGGGSGPSPPRPAETSGSCPPAAIQPWSRPAERISGSHSVAHDTHL